MVAEDQRKECWMRESKGNVTVCIVHHLESFSFLLLGASHHFKWFHQLIDWPELAFLLVQLLFNEDKALCGCSTLNRCQQQPRGDQM